MPRNPRLDLPGLPQHVVQRGHDRLPCFAAEDDYARYLFELDHAARRHDCAIHAYVLMTNHVHLLVTPAQRGGLGRMMQALGRRYVGAFNARYQRTGTLWESRYKACLVDTDEYLLRCYRYIELNPVRAGMVSDPAMYPWSSFGFNGMGAVDRRITPHTTYLQLDPRPTARHEAYRRWIREAVGAEELTEIRTYLQQGRAWGSRRFQEHIEHLLGRTAATRGRGRPSQGS